MESLEWLNESDLKAIVEFKNLETRRFEKRELAAKEVLFQGTRYYVCPIKHCQFLTADPELFKSHCRYNKHSPLFLFPPPDKSKLVADGSAYCPKSLQYTNLVADSRSRVAICLTGRFILTKDEIPLHCLICPDCLDFKLSEAANDREFATLATYNGLDEFHIKTPSDLPNPDSGGNYKTFPMIDGVKLPYAGLTLSTRYLCIPCMASGAIVEDIEETEIKDPTLLYWACEQHLFKYHNVILELADRNMVSCRAMGFRLLGESVLNSQPQHRVVLIQSSITEDRVARPGPISNTRRFQWDF